MKDLARALRELAALFERMGTPYAVMGGLAVRIYGIPRPTFDVDFTIAIPRDRLMDLYDRIEDLGYSVPEAYRSGWVDEVAGLPLIKFRLFLEGRGIDVDVFLAEQEFQQQMLSRRRRAEINGLFVWLVSPEDLILLKLLARRPRDLADIGDVLFTQGQLDETYLRQWADALGVRDALEQTLADAQ